MGVYAWCPECGALRHLAYSIAEASASFDWPRWVVPGDIDKAHKLLRLNEEAEAQRSLNRA